MYKAYRKYVYDGPVVAFNQCLTSRWKGETMAPTERKARSNLIYQFKRQNNKVAGSKVSLPGKIKMVN